MFLEELEVRGIRNLQPQKISFERRVSVISGRNGQGKTSLLEAIYLLSQTRSFRTAQRRDVIAWQSSEKSGFVRGLVRSGLGKREISLLLERGKRTLELDGKRAEAAGQFFGQLRCVTFTPEELQLVKGSPQIRREYVDRTLSLVDANYLRDLVQYQRALKHRNTLLAMREPPSDAELEPWEQLLAAAAIPLAGARKAFLESIGPSCQQFYRNLANRGLEALESSPKDSSGESITLEYRSKFCRPEGPVSVEEAAAIFRDSRAQDRRLKSTHTGVHRDDLDVGFQAPHVSGAAKSLASQGQTRTIALALKLAAVEFIELRSGEAPLILLDDVESELDSSRREGLFELLQASRNQVIVTTTDPSWAPAHRALDVAAFGIENGQISSIS